MEPSFERVEPGFGLSLRVVILPLRQCELRAGEHGGAGSGHRHSFTAHTLFADYPVSASPLVGVKRERDLVHNSGSPVKSVHTHQPSGSDY